MVSVWSGHLDSYYGSHFDRSDKQRDEQEREREWSRDWGKKNEVSWICVRQTGKKVDADCKYCGSWATKPLACAQFFLHTLIESEFIVSTSEWAAKLEFYYMYCLLPSHHSTFPHKHTC